MGLSRPITILTAALAVSLSFAAPATAASATQDHAINNLARTPYLGWNTYYGIGTAFDEADIKSAADALVSRGLKAAGYQYVWIDGGWWSGTRDANGNITVDEKQWPDGMKAVADYIHSKGLKAGIYTDAGANGCGGANQGSYGRYQQDVDQFAGWGYDAVKVDFCGGTQLGLDPAVAYGQFRDALLNNSSHRPMLFNICNPFLPGEYAPGDPPYDRSVLVSPIFGPTTGNSWRTDTDVGFQHNVQFSDVLRNLDQDAVHPESAGPGHWNDPDYLAPELGMTPAESQTQFSMWSMVAAPLIIGSDVRAITPATISMLTNREVLAVDQDPLGRQGIAIATDGNTQVWVKPLANGDRAVALLNRGSTPAVVGTDAGAVGLPQAGQYDLRDLWQHSTTESAGRIAATVPPHGTVLFRVSAGSGATVAPSVVLGPPTTPAPYPGSDLRLAVPGQPFTVTTTLTDDGRTPIRNTTLTLSAPSDWTVQPSSTAVFGTVPTGRTVTATWTVTAPPDTAPGTDPLSVTSRWSWGHQVSTTEDTAVTVPSVLPSGQPYLSDHPWLDGTSGWQVPIDDHEVGGGPMAMLGRHYANGIGTASVSRIDFYLGGRCTTFTATIGIDDAVDFDPNGGTVTFAVGTDGTQRYDSGLVTRTANKTISIDVTGATVLSLDVGDGGDGTYNDRADWADPQMTCS